MSEASSDDLELSVVIPCLNEEGTIAIVIEKALRTMREHAINGEVVVSDNGSDDNSRDVALAAGARVAPCPTRGYGAALQNGFQAAKGRYVLMGDADDSYDFQEIPRFLERTRAGDKYVMGTRLGGTIMPGAMPFLNRWLGTPVLTFVLNFLFGTKITDCNSGMRCIERDTVLSLGLSSPGMEFASELIVKAAIMGVTIVEVPITLHVDKRGRPPHLRRWRDGWRHLRLLLWHAPDQTLTNPGFFTLLLGLMLAISQLFGPFTLGRVHFDIHYMVLGLTLALLGASATTMGLVVHATLGGRGLRTSWPWARAHEWFTFDRAVIVGVVAFVVGLVADGWVLVKWLASHGGALTSFDTRLSLLGLLSIAIGFQVVLAAMLLGTTQIAMAPRLSNR
jgi:hypothetical protein